MRPANGYVTNVQLREGSYVHIGTPVITLRRRRPGGGLSETFARNVAGPVARPDNGLALPSAPCRAGCSGLVVVSVGWGVSQGQGVPSGQLPDVKVPESWVPPAQRFSGSTDSR